MLLVLSAVLYLVSFFLSTLFYYFNMNRYIPQFTLFLAVSVYFVGVFVKALVTQSFPFGHLYGFYSLLGNFIILFLVVFSFVNTQISRFFAFLSVSGFLLTLLAIPSEPSPYKNLLFALHVVFAAIGYTGAFLGCLSSFLKITLESKLKSKNVSGFFLPISTLADSEKRLINVAFLMLTLTLIFGSLWSKNFFGRHWVDDPKLIFTLLVWLYYATVVHFNLLKPLKPKRVSQLSIIGGLFALINLAFIRHEL